MARDIASALGRFNKRDGYLENQEYVISWAVGHLVELAEPHDYDQAYAQWNLSHLPIIPDQFVLKPVKNNTKQLEILKQLLQGDFSEVINACDAGREGESIFRRIYQFCQCSKPVKRLWLSETTPAAIKKAFSQLRDGVELDNLAAAAEARSQADWLVGINASRAFSVRHHAVLSVGRVQTPTLNLVVTKEREIRNFKSANYWELWASFSTHSGAIYKGKWTEGENDRIFSKAELENILTSISQLTTGQVTNIEQKETKEQPPMLFNLNDLQKEANRRHGLTAQQTLDAAQALYEKHKLLTYPRTDSRHLTVALAESLPNRLASLAGIKEYSDLIPNPLPKLSKRYVDDAKVTDHHAIIPTAMVPNWAKLNKSEQLVYRLVVGRFLAIFYPDARYAVTKVTTRIGHHDFIAKGKVELAAGWKVIYKHARSVKKDEEQEQHLPPLRKNETVNVQQLETPEKQTKPPKRYTEATLLAAMENAGKLIDDSELADSLKEAGGIGTAATRAAIIERLIKVGYIKRQRKTLVPTAKGESLIELVPEEVKSVELTARWEERLKHIEQGQEQADNWLMDIKNFTATVVKLVRAQTPQTTGVNVERPILGPCPLCGKVVVEGKKGYGCSGWKEGCKFVIWKEIAGKKLTEKQVKDLLEKASTDVIKGFKSKTGKSFEAMLKISPEGKVEFVFPGQKPVVLGPCLVCGKHVVETPKGYSCSGWREGCKFVIWKNIAGKQITYEQAKQLLDNGKSEVIAGFTANDGKQFNACLSIDRGGKLILVPIP